MRFPLVAVLSLLAAPLSAQGYPLHPAPSPLFAREASTETSPRPHLMTVGEGTGLGVVMGVTLGAFFGAYQAHSHPCRCDDPGLEPFEFAFLGGVVGGLVGGGLAEERRARAERRADSLAPPRLMTENGTPLTGDSLRLVGKDHHGVRGGIAGGLMGGAVGFVVPHLAYALDHAHAGVDFGSTGTDHGPGTLPVLVSTATGALSGYLIAAALSRR